MRKSKGAISIGKRITTLRTGREMTQDQLGAKVRRTRSAIAQWECGYSSPGANVLTALAKALDTTIDAIISGAV